MKNRRSLLVLSAAVSCLAPALASGQVRSVYGYIGHDTVDDVNRIVITDVSSGPNYGRTYTVSFGWNKAYRAIEWYCRDLPANHSFFVDVWDRSNRLACWTGFWLPSGWSNFKAKDMRF